VLRRGLRKIGSIARYASKSSIFQASFKVMMVMMMMMMMMMTMVMMMMVLGRGWCRDCGCRVQPLGVKHHERRPTTRGLGLGRLTCL
jgi:hypothetical protein